MVQRSVRNAPPSTKQHFLYSLDFPRHQAASTFSGVDAVSLAFYGRQRDRNSTRSTGTPKRNRSSCFRAAAEKGAHLNKARCPLMASVSFVSIAWLLTSILSSQMRMKTCALNGSGKMFGLHSTWERASTSQRTYRDGTFRGGRGVTR